MNKGPREGWYAADVINRGTCDHIERDTLSNEARDDHVCVEELEYSVCME